MHAQVKSALGWGAAALVVSASAGCSLFKMPHEESNHFPVYPSQNNESSIQIDGAKVYSDVVDNSGHILFAQVNGASDSGNRVNVNISPNSGNNNVVFQSDDSKYGGVYVNYSNLCPQDQKIKVNVGSGLASLLTAVGLDAEEAKKRETLLSIEKANHNHSWGSHSYEFVYTNHTIHGSILADEIKKIPGEQAKIVAKSLPHVDLVVETVRLSCGDNGPSSSTTILAATKWASNGL